MKHLLITLFLFSSLAAFGQASRVYWLSPTLIVIANPDGTNRKPLPFNTVRPRESTGDNQVTFGYDTGGPTMTPSQFLDANGSPWGANITAAMTAFMAAIPAVSSGGSGGFTAATIGTAPDVATSYTTATGSITTTNFIDIYIENTGNAAGTVTYAGITLPLAAKDWRRFSAKYDKTSNKYAPYPTISGDASGTVFVVIKTPKQ